jgi:hypothetical protein
MKYLAMFFCSYLLAFLVLLLWSKRQIDRMSQRLETVGTKGGHIARFKRQAWNLHLLVRPIVFFGTLGGLLISVGYWLVT